MSKVDINELAGQVDQYIDDKDVESLKRSLSNFNSIEQEDNTDLEKAGLMFIRANIYSALRNIDGESTGWDWHSEYLEKEIFYLRFAANYIEPITYQDDRTDLRFRIYTNLGNALNHIGRFAEAIEQWNKALDYSESYSMALGNKGFGLTWYAKTLYDPNHQILFYWEARKCLINAIAQEPELHAQEGFSNILDAIDKMANWDEFDYDYPEEKLGRSKKETKYRQWALDHRLFLNPLNDLGDYSIAANDVLSFPSFTIPINQDLNGRQGRPPEVYGIYNQLKQEYVSARFLIFESFEESIEPLHYSDKRVSLVDTLDYRIHRLWAEKLKMAFLSTYAILDKIAYLINMHWALNIPSHKMNFRTIWYKNNNRKQGLLEQFDNSNNWPLRGLFWLSKDIFYELDDFTPIDPEARQIHHIRNHIAHKYLTVHDSLWNAGGQLVMFGHETSYPLNDFEIKAYSLKLLKLARNALIYVSLGAHYQEEFLSDKTEQGFIGTMPLMDIPDEYRL